MNCSFEDTKTRKNQRREEGREIRKVEGRKEGVGERKKKKGEKKEGGLRISQQWSTRRFTNDPLVTRTGDSLNIFEIQEKTLY